MNEEQAREARSEISKERVKRFDEIRATLAARHNFKKGDKVLNVHVDYEHGGTGKNTVTAEWLLLTSFGKRQGTGIKVINGKNHMTRIWRDHGILVASVAEVEEIAAKVGAIYAYESVLGSLHCALANYPNLRAEFRAKSDAEIARLEAITLESCSTQIVIQGDNQ